MGYIKKPNILKKIGRILSQNSPMIDKFHLSLIEAQVNRKLQTRNQLRQLFKAVISYRRGASRERGELAIKSFDKIVDKLIQETDNLIRKKEFSEAHRHLFESLCEKTKNVNQKIISVYLEFVVNYLGIWEELLPHLYVPIDTWISQMIKDHLQVGILPFEQDNTSISKFYKKDREKTKRYEDFMNFQEELKAIAESIGEKRIIFDGLWFIGYAFHRKYPLCERCWINRVCRSKEKM